MGYSYYTLPDGREAGYGVEATCDSPVCEAQIDRGMGYLCGEAPNGWRDEDEPGCGKYYCGQHSFNHQCTHPQCPKETDNGDICELAAEHEGDHRA